MTQTKQQYLSSCCFAFNSSGVREDFEASTLVFANTYEHSSMWKFNHNDVIYSHSFRCI